MDRVIRILSSPIREYRRRRDLYIKLEALIDPTFLDRAFGESKLTSEGVTE